MEFTLCLKSLACLGLCGPVGYLWFWETAVAPVTHCLLPFILKMGHSGDGMKSSRVHQRSCIIHFRFNFLLHYFFVTNTLEG